MDYDYNCIKKRALSKVRKHFLNKRIEENEEIDVDPATRYLSNHEVCLLNTCLGCVEKNRKITVSTHYLNYLFQIKDIAFQDQSLSRSVVMSLERKKTMLAPIEYTAKRLESYGDLDLALWAQKISKYQANYQKLISDYCKLLNSNDPKIYADLRKAKNQAILACKEIESQCAYRKLLIFFNKDSMEPMASYYSETFINQLGHTVESFISKAKSEGMPAISAACSGHVDVVKRFMDHFPLENGLVQKQQDYKALLFQKDGPPKETILQFISVFEPVEEGFFVSAYFIIKNNESTIEYQEKKNKNSFNFWNTVKKWPKNETNEMICEDNTLSN